MAKWAQTTLRYIQITENNKTPADEQDVGGECQG